MIIMVFPSLSWGREISILFVVRPQRWVRQIVDPLYKEKLNGLGYEIGTSTYGSIGWKKLSRFNVMVLSWAPQEGDLGGKKIYQDKIPLFLQYIKQGGGVLVTVSEAYHAYRTVNKFLQKLGAEILPEGIIDKRNSFRQRKYLEWWFFSTSNLSSHPVNRGIKKLFFPLMHSPGGQGTLSLKVSPPWKVVVRGEKEARTDFTYSSEPPLVAVRNWREGRIAILPSHSTFWISAPYHRIWEKIVIEKGDGFKFLHNLYRWLAEPSLRSGKFGGFREPPKKVMKKPSYKGLDIYRALEVAGRRKKFPHPEFKKEGLNIYRGVIGAHTSLTSRGKGTVKEWVKEAKGLGFDFIIFTEPLEEIDEKKWEFLKKETQKFSDGSFVAIPGIRYQDRRGNNFIAFNLPHWPNKDWLSEGGKKVKSLPGFYFGLSWVPVYLSRVEENPEPPWFLKFYSGMALFTYEKGRLISRAVDKYLRVQDDDYNLIPISEHLVYSPRELEKVGRYLTYVLASSVRNIPSQFKYRWYAPRYVFVSSGPKIEEFNLTNGRGGAREEPWGMYIKVSSEVPLKKVTLLDRGEIFREYRPYRLNFEKRLVGFHEKQRHFILIVEDEEGKRAISPALYTSDLRHSTYMCTDLQNTLNFSRAVDEEGNIVGYGVLGAHVTGWGSFKMGVLVPERKLFPEGLDYQVKGFDVGTGGRVKKEGGRAEIDMVFNSGDVNILDKYFYTHLLPGSVVAPRELAEVRSRLISFTPRPYSYNLLMVEQEVRFKKKISFEEEGGLELSFITCGGSSQSFKNYAYIGKEGKKRKGRRENDTTIMDKLPRGGYVSLFPDFYGSFAIFPLDKGYDFIIKGASVQLGYNLGGKIIPQGRKLTNKFLVVRGKWGEEDEKGFDLIRNLYGLNGEPAYRIELSQGKVINSVFSPLLKAENYGVKGKITSAKLPNPLGVRVKGVNSNWDAGMWDIKNNEFRRAGVFKDTLYLILDISREREFVIGNFLTATHPDLKISILTSLPQVVKKKEVEIEVHNPTSKEIKAKIKGNPLFPLFSQLRERVLIPPGESMILGVSLR